MSPMKRLAAAAVLALAACSGPQARRAGQVKLGVDVLAERGFSDLRGKRVGLIVNHTSKDSRGRGTVDLIAAAPGVTLAAIFSPEHGFTGSSEDSKLSNETLTVERRAVPVVSLYKGGFKGMRPDPADLVGLDALVFDIQDIGARFYTYNATMGMALEEAKKADIEFIVLDRPNPVNGVAIQGPVLDEPSLRQLSAVSYFAIPVRHGMTTGELARLHNADVKHDKLKVIQAEGWTRAQWFDDTRLPWTPPSPNMPTLASATLYPGIACLEFSNLSVGRGTPEPFLWFGAPWIDGDELAQHLQAALLDGVEFSAQTRTPSKSTHAGQSCGGVRIKIVDRNQIDTWAVYAAVLTVLRELHPNDFKPNWIETRKLVGTDRVQRLYERGAGVEELTESFRTETERFEEARRPFLLYQ
jgi:uncharacterized protein YbbC (DUF1343 family)